MSLLYDLRRAKYPYFERHELNTHAPYYRDKYVYFGPDTFPKHDVRLVVAHSALSATVLVKLRDPARGLAVHSNRLLEPPTIYRLPVFNAIKFEVAEVNSVVLGNLLGFEQASEEAGFEPIELGGVEIPEGNAMGHLPIFAMRKLDDDRAAGRIPTPHLALLQPSPIPSA